jgi:hypothetical protein
MSVRLYVGNLPKESVERQSLQDLFVDLAEVITIKIIKDRKTNKCRGFAFVTVPTDEIADQFIEKYNGLEFIDGTLKIEKALPRVKGKGKEEEEGLVTEELENTEQTEDSAKAEVTKPSPANGERKKSNKKQRPPRGQQKQSEGAKSYSSDDGSIQPDPRWASELAKLKDMLSTQTANT